MKQVKKTVFETEWFCVEQVSFPEVEAIKDEHYYRVTSPDGVIVLATTAEDEIVLVRQFRPALASYTLEFPAGAIDSGETPERAARRELQEETGFSCETLVSLGSGYIMMNRHDCRLHSFYAPRVRRETVVSENGGVELHLVSFGDFKELVLGGQFDQYAALALLQRAEWQLGVRLVR
jgi:ADP-ribose pyrophosphatase